MTVEIVSDSVSDLPVQIAQEIRVSPIITPKDGKVEPSSITHSRARVIEYLSSFVLNFSGIRIIKPRQNVVTKC